MSFTVTVTKNAVAISGRVESTIQSQYGRQDVTSSCSPQTVSFSVVYDSAGLGTLDPNLFAIGDRIIISIQNAALTAANYFSGTITDITARHHEMDIIATSDTLSSVNRTPLTLAAQTSQTSGTVVNAALTAIQAVGALPGKTITTSTGAYSVTTPVQAGTNATAFLDTVVASEPAGVLCEIIGGIRFSSYDDRRIATMPAAQKFDFSALGSVIGWDWQLEKTVADFVNYCQISSTAGTSIYSDTASVTASGTYARSFSTYLDTLTDADYYALRTVQHGLTPGWRTSGIVLDLAALSDANRDAVLKNMRTGSYIKLPTLLSGAQTEYFVEGWTDTITYSTTGTRQWFRELYLSDIKITQAAQRYVDVTSGITYATVTPTLRWLDLEQTNI